VHVGCPGQTPTVPSPAATLKPPTSPTCVGDCTLKVKTPNWLGSSVVGPVKLTEGGEVLLWQRVVQVVPCRPECPTVEALPLPVA